MHHTHFTIVVHEDNFPQQLGRGPLYNGVDGVQHVGKFLMAVEGDDD